MTSTVFVTGATSGFGRAIAQVFAQNGWRTVITGRRTDRLDALAAELSQAHDVEVLSLAFDIRDRASVDRASEELARRGWEVDILVNNAGLALGRDPIQEGNPDDWDTMLDTNVKGLLYMTRALAPAMVKRGSGHIINIGSTAGKEAYPGGNVYCASKYAVNALSQAMRIDLLPHGIKVTQVSPGAAETEFSLVRLKGDEDSAKAVYNGYEPMRAEDIANVVWFAANQPPHLCLNDIVMTSVAQANSHYIHRDA